MDISNLMDACYAYISYLLIQAMKPKLTKISQEQDKEVRRYYKTFLDSI
jgi:threonine/homoserine/homoserine lactone efflux protein